MVRDLTRVLRITRLRAAALTLLVAVLGVSSCDSAGPLDTSAPDVANNDGNTGVTSTAPTLASVTYVGIPFGPVGLWGGYTDVKWGPKPFTHSQNSDDAFGVVSRINAARSMGQRLVLNLTGGGAKYYTTNGQFDMTKWKNKMNTYKTTTIKNAVAAGVSDGTIIGTMLIDEPETKRWGTNITKSTIDQMATYSKQIFPTLATGINHGPPGYKWRSSERYHVLDYVLYQYNYWITSGNVTSWRDAVLNQARLDGVRPALGVNILDGGKPDYSGAWDCTDAGQAGKGTYSNMCRMTTDQLRTWGKALTTYGCFMLLWRYDGTYMSKSSNQDAFRELATLAASKPRPSCRRP
jgi:hypothetical protein